MNPQNRSRSRRLLPLGLWLAFGLLPFLDRAGGPAPARQPEQRSPAPSGPLTAEWLRPLTWRCIGPASMGGRITALAVYDRDPTTYFVATASGGLLKTVNNGTTFEHLFDREATVSVGDVQVAQSDPKIVWVGTGENNPRNSVSYGDGVYRSADGGKTWRNMGLKETFQVGRIAIHPTRPDTVYVGALGRLYGPNQDRGLYKTTDGGRSWDKVLYVDDKTGVIDVQMNPANPEELLAATWERQRDGFDTNDPAKKWGPGSGVYKTTDGGKHWTRVKKGLPTCALGRIGLCYYRKDPRIVYAVVESEKIGTGPPRAVVRASGLGLGGADAEDAGARLTRVAAGGPAAKAGLRRGDVIVALDGRRVRSYAGLLRRVRDHQPGDKVKVRADRAGKVRDFEVVLGRPAAGRAGRPADPKRPYGSSLGGQEANAQAEQGPGGFECGGVYRSTDGGDSWTRVNSLNPRPMYFSQVRVDPGDDRRVYVLGISLHRSDDGGKTFRTDVRGVHGDHHALWIDPRDGRHLLLGNDGGVYVSYDRAAHWDRLNQVAIGQFYHVVVDSRRPYHVYGGLQDNGVWGGPSRTRRADGPVNEDWVRLSGGDGFGCRVDPDDPDLVYYETQWGRYSRRNLRTGEAAPVRPRPRRGKPYRFNWNSPFLLSHHNPRVFYAAGDVVFRSLDRGNDLRVISPEITRTGKGSATALSESPRNPDVLWAGTDDGYLWVTRDGGTHWENVTKNVGLPGPRWVASVEASHFAEGRAYAAFDAHRSDDDRPYVYATEDYGKTWKPLRANLPWGSTRVLREDPANPDLLYLGTEFAAWASPDRGRSWAKINNNLPTVAIHDFALHAASGELVAATHGRSLWVCDVSALRQLTPEARQAAAFLYKPTPAVRWRTEPSRGGTSRRFVGENPPRGAALYYSLGRTARSVGLKVVDIEGKTVRVLRAATEPGLHKVVWNLAGPAQRTGARSGRPGAAGRPVPPGTYKVVLTVDGKEYSRALRVEADPDGPAADGIAGEGEEEDDGGR